ncbi:hypothetical protein ES703_123565 [subsurface metagenome]
MHQHDRGTVITCLLQQFLRLLDVGGQDSVGALQGGKGRVADEQRLARLDVVLVADGRHQEVFLVEGVPQRLANLGIVERFVQVVGAEHVLRLQHRRHDDLDIGVFLQRPKQVMARLLHHVEFALLQRIDRLLRVGNGTPLDAVHLGDLPAGQA